MYEVLAENWNPYGRDSHVNVELKVAMNPLYRPKIPNAWLEQEVMQECTYMMQLCWSADQEERPSFAHIRASLVTMIKNQ